MNPDSQVGAHDLIRAGADDLISQARAVEAVADRVTEMAHAVPDPAPVPRWATTTAAGLAGSAFRQQADQLGRDIIETARRIRASAAAYQESDERAANRFRLSR
jgi:hypothetical protein